MKHFKYLLFVLLAGTCTGVFFYTRSFPALRIYTGTGGDSSILWAFSSLSQLGKYLLVANLILLGIWFVYSLVYSKLFSETLKNTLQLDAHTYLPLCFLAISLIQFNTLLTYHFEGLLLLSQSAGYLLLLVAIIAIYYLKAQNHRRLPHTITRKTASTSSKQLPSWRIKLLIFLVSFVIYALVGLRLTDPEVLGPGGDEPHYLLITHSILHDHDLAIRNNYKQRDYQAFFPGKLDVHVTIAKDDTRYSIHPIGMPLLLVPAYALKGYQGAVLFMNVMAALLGFFLFLIAFSVTQHKYLSLLLWFVLSFTPPLLLYSSQLYPEIPSALLLAAAYYIISSQKHKKLSHAIVLGGILAFLPWVQQRMILPAVLLLLYHLFLTYRSKKWDTSSIYFAVIPSIFLALSGLGMAGYYYALFKSPMPSAAYNRIGIDIFSRDIMLREGLLGLFFDQEAGLLTYAPYFLFVFVGFLLLLRRNIPLVVFLLLTITSIYIPCAGFTLKWRGAWSPVSRYMVALIPLFFIPLCLGVKHTTCRIYRYTFFFLVMISFYWSCLFLYTPFSAIMRNNGINVTFEQASNLIDITQYFPSFTVRPTASLVITGIWIGIICVFSAFAYRSASTQFFPLASGHFSSENESGNEIKQIFTLYALLIVGVLLYTSFVTWTTGRNIPSQTSKNRYLHEFLNNFDYHAIIKTQISREQPVFDNELRFEYISREKSGRVGSPRGERFIVTGPREPFPKGRYTAYFKISIEDNSTDEIVATIDVAINRGTDVFNGRSLRGTDFSTSGEYELFPLIFELREDVKDLETRVYFHNRVNLKVKKIYIEPDLAELYYDSGLSALREAKYHDARTLFLRATSVSQHLLSLYQLGIIEQSSGNWKRSIELLQQVVEHDPAFADAYYRLGLAYKEHKDLERARQFFEKATHLLPTHVDAWNALKDTYQQVNMGEQAENVEQTLATLYQPQHPYAVNFANLIMFMGYSIQNPTPRKLHLEYYWKALSPMKKDYAFFIHFKQFRTKFQQDHIPQLLDPLTGKYKQYMTSQWQAGELVHEQYEISAPAGTFEIELGVWDPFHTKKRLPIISTSQKFSLKNTRIKLGSITVNE
jgi:tetratricopeptide (TPR) repeat protein